MKECIGDGVDPQSPKRQKCTNSAAVSSAAASQSSLLDEIQAARVALEDHQKRYTGSAFSHATFYFKPILTPDTAGFCVQASLSTPVVTPCRAGVTDYNTVVFKIFFSHFS